MTRLYMAHSSAGIKTIEDLRRLGRKIDWLVSHPYLKTFERADGFGTAIQTMLDSGAYSAWHSIQKVNIEPLIVEARKERWNEVVALDVVGNPEQTLKNTLYMREQLRSEKAMPVFHYGEAWEFLDEYCRLFPKVGLSCRFGESTKQSLTWLDQCYARTWPHQFHSFGWVSKAVLERYPFDSADTASWVVATRQFGRFRSLGDSLPKNALKQKGAASLLIEVEWYLKKARWAAGRWRKELKKAEDKACQMKQQHKKDGSLAVG